MVSRVTRMPLTNSESRRNATAAASSGPRRPRAHVAGERCRIRLLPIVVAVLAALALPTAAQAADVLSVTAPKGACRVLVGRRLVAVGGQAGLRITARLAVNPRAVGGRYTVTLRCAGAASTPTVKSPSRLRSRRGTESIPVAEARTARSHPPPRAPWQGNRLAPRDSAVCAIRWSARGGGRRRAAATRSTAVGCVAGDRGAVLDVDALQRVGGHGWRSC